MRPLPSPNPSTSSSTRRPAPLPWAAIYQSFPTALAVPTESARSTMRSSKSQLSLRDLSDGAEGSDLDRTANSTPAQKGMMREALPGSHYRGSLTLKSDSTFGQGATFTPPIGKPTKWTNSSNAQKQDHSNGNESGIYLEVKAEDDVFSGDSRPRADTVRKSYAAGQESVEEAVNSNTTSIGNLTLDTGTHTQAAGTPATVQVADDTIAPRSDRLLEPITPSNAQGVLPPAAAIFVAKYDITSHL